MQAVIFGRNATGPVLGVSSTPVRARMTHHSTNGSVAFLAVLIKPFLKEQGTDGFVLPEGGFNVGFPKARRSSTIAASSHLN